MKIIQLTDTHLMPPGLTACGVDPEAQLRAAVADIMARQADADLLVITGDLCNDGDAEAYELLREPQAARRIGVVGPDLCLRELADRHFLRRVVKQHELHGVAGVLGADQVRQG